jgi:hypothetical protein
MRVFVPVLVLVIGRLGGDVAALGRDNARFHLELRRRVPDAEALVEQHTLSRASSFSCPSKSPSCTTCAVKLGLPLVRDQT